MRFIITCGGSGGHINPALAVARLLRENGHDVLFIGAEMGMERDLVPREGFPIKLLDVRSLSHSLSPGAISRNIKTLAKAAGAVGKARAIIREYRPRAVLGTGGYASYPALRAASGLKIKVLVHESNASPGITTKAAAKRAELVLVGMESCRAAYKDQSRVRVVGTPVRPEFFTEERLNAREALKLDNRPAVVSIFGSQGARDMNRITLEMMKLEGGEWQHIHAAGPKRYDALAKKAAERGLVFDGGTGLRLLDYINNMAQVMAAADIIICRAGASTLAELAAAGKPAILIPSPNVTADHQSKNARMFEAAGGAVVLPEAGLTAEALYLAAKELLKNTAEREKMSASLKSLAVSDSAERIAELMIK
jgi:UDP-N-acetylglucosamine--N-acetylmuramyl-(pentapeptide) pyrophosphoryl-undecaprenol N-acetylglucosamine transferase